MIRVNVFIQVNETYHAELLATAQELAKLSLQEDGCVAYDVFQSTTRPDVLMICETWAKAESLAAHEATPHFSALVGKMQDMGELKLEKFNF